MAHEPITVPELCGLAERCNLIRQRCMERAMEGQGAPHELFVEAHSLVYRAATYLVLWMKVEYGAELPESVQVLDKTFTKDEARAWALRVHETLRRVVEHGSGKPEAEQHAELWRRLYIELTNLLVVAAVRDREGEEVRTPDLRLHVPGEG